MVSHFSTIHRKSLEENLTEKKKVISDSSCIILFERIGELDLLRQIFGQLKITTEIAAECGIKLASWFKLKDPTSKNLQNVISMNIDQGEASAIALAMDLNDSIVILDDLKGRKTERLGIKFIGSLGIIVQAKRKVIVHSIRPIMKKIRRTNFYLTREPEEMVYILADEK